MKLPKFDIHAPFDAPIRAQKRREQAERARTEKAMKDPKVKRALRKIVREAYARVKAR